MKIRKAKIEDAKEIAKLRKDTFKYILSKNYPKEHLIEFYKKNTVRKIKEKINKNENIYCIIKDKKILGTIYLKGDLIGGLYVRHDKIGQKVGTKLLKFIEKIAKKKGIKKVKLLSTKYAYGFYLKNKYKLIKKGFWTVNNKRARNYNMEKKL